MNDYTRNYRRIAEHGKALSLLPAILDLTHQPAVHALLAAFSQGHKLLTCGNGGSHAQASHLAAELTVRFETDRRALPAVCLSADPTALTACGNDYGYGRSFSRQVEALGTAGDVLMAFSTSGTSQNVLEALRMARQRGMGIIGVSGRKGFGTLCDIDIIAPGDSTAVIQEMHLLIVHMLMEGIEMGVPS